LEESESSIRYENNVKHFESHYQELLKKYPGKIAVTHQRKTTVHDDLPGVLDYLKENEIPMNEIFYHLLDHTNNPFPIP